MIFGKLLIDWYLLHKRDLPWRNTTNPYHIYLSEIILQQTRVNQGLPYYERFVTQFPTVFDLATATEQEVLKAWQGLGYYSRARNMHHTAQYVVDTYNGVFPTQYVDLLKLKGVGLYTAAAIASFSANEPVAVVDGNVMRVLSRVYAIDADISGSTTRAIFQDLADTLLLKKKSALFNQAIMEFGALQCVPKNPNCSVCVFQEYCQAKALNKIDQLPVKTKKTKVTKRYLHYLVTEDTIHQTIIEKREGKGVWENLYQFPLLETTDTLIPNDFTAQIKARFSDHDVSTITQLNDVILHKLSHQELHIQFWKITLFGIISDGILIKKTDSYPFPIVLANFIKNYWSSFYDIS